MSALGQKQTFAPQEVMSALPPKADMCGARAHVCFGPIADIAKLFDGLLGEPRIIPLQVNNRLRRDLLR